MTLREALNRLNELPKGYISKKTIKGKSYYYFQYAYINKLISRYIKDYELKDYKEKIKERKRLERFIYSYKKQKEFTLSINANNISGYLMSEDIVIAKFINGSLVKYFNEKLAPLYIKRTKDIESYLKSRTIDLTRPNARLLLKQLGITNKDKYIALYAYGATIQDHYWFKPLHSKKTYKDIKFDNDMYADIALKGKILQVNKLGSHSPELTNIGSFEKCWRLINNKWYLYKKGNEDEIYSELFVYKLAKNLNMHTAVYELDDGYIRSLNFAEKYNFEPMIGLANDNESNDYIFNLLYDLDINIAIDYIKLLWLDAIVYNVDRHNQNFGLLRDRHTGKIISLAPNFDNNMALLSYNKELNQIPNRCSFLDSFISFVNKNKQIKDLYKTIKFPIINESILDKTLDECPKNTKKDKIKSFILDRYKFIKFKLG